MAVLRLFASIRVAAGTGTVNLEGSTVGEIITAATQRFGNDFAVQVPNCQLWLNGHATQHDAPVTATDEVALLPPVSGGR